MKLSWIALLFLPFFLFAEKPIGKVISLKGEAVVRGKGKVRPLQQDSKIFLKDIIEVPEGSELAIELSDRSVINFLPKTKFVVEKYRYNQLFRKDVSSSFLIQGGIRVVSGEIAKSKNAEYEIKTPSATIGLRGTILKAKVKDDKTLAMVEEGRAVVKNQAGEIFIGEGEPSQSAVVLEKSAPPQEATYSAYQYLFSN